MRPDALLFQLDGTLAEYQIDYGEVLAALAAQPARTRSARDWTTPFDALTALKQEMKPRDYKAIERKITRMIDELEAAQVLRATILPFVKETLPMIQEMKVRLGVVTELGKRAAERLLTEHGLRAYLDVVSARIGLAPPKGLEDRILDALQRLRVQPETCLFFCSSAREIQVARSLKVRTVAIPTKRDSITSLLQVKPDRLIVSFEELPDLLAHEQAEA